MTLHTARAEVTAALILVLGLVVGPGLSSPSVADPGDIVVTAAGDIIGGCSTYPCDYDRVSDVVLASGSRAVLALGDVSNNSGSATDYTQRFGRGWGRFLPAVAPVPGNHDYGTSAAANYYSYFGSAAHGPAGYYSFDLGTWHFVAVNSNCSQVGGCGSGSPQETWLRNDLAAHPTACTVAFWHHPRYSSGYEGDNTAMAPIFADLYAAGADIVLSGHSHDYERFAPQDNASRYDAARGITQFVVGTGGSFFTSIGSAKPNSAARQNSAMGALQLTLHASSYDWRFLPIAGASYSDSGTGTCHNAGRVGSDTQAPTAPSALSAAAGSGGVALGWAASSDDVGVREYLVYRNGTQVGTTPTTSYTDSAVQPLTTYTYAVRAVDAAGNLSAPSNDAQVTTPPAPSTVSVPVAADATIDQSHPTTPLGTASRLTVDSSPVNDALLRFDLTGVGCAVTAARLRLTVGSGSNDGSPSGGDFQAAASSSWTESGVTWSSAPARAGAVLGTLGRVAVGATYTVDVTPAVQPGTVLTIRASSRSGDGARYYSREGSSTQAPRLELTCGSSTGDTQPPSAPGALSATAGGGGVVLAWTAGADDVGVTGYRVYRGGTAIATTTATGYTDGAVAPATTYTYTVTAYDAAGNESPPSNAATVTTPAGPRTVTVPVTADATVDASRPTTALGGATRITIDHSPVNDALLRFEVPTGCTVTRATLQLTVGSTSNDNSPRGGDFRAAVDSSWTEGAVTWNTAPAASGGVVASLGAVALRTTYSIDVTPLVHAPGPLTIRASSTSSDGARYYSKEGSATGAPRLVLTCG